MPLVAIARFLFTLVGLLILAAAVYLIWTGIEGEPVALDDGTYGRVRDEWRLWLGGGLLLWSALGRWATLLLVARPDDGPNPFCPGTDGQRLITAQGDQLHYQVGGRESRGTIILTHGWGMDLTIWNGLRTGLEARHRVIAWDLPGLGRSRAAGGPLTLERLAADLREVIDLVPGEKVLLVGHSIGGMIIQTAARESPEMFSQRVAGVVLFNTTHTNPLETMQAGGLARALQPLIKLGLHLTVALQPLAWLLAWLGYFNGTGHLANRLGFGRTVTRRQLDHTTLLATRNPPGIQARGILAMIDWDARRGLGTVVAPTTVVCGALDVVTKPSAGATIAAQAGTSSPIVIPEVNHMGFLERAAAYEAVVEAAVQGAGTSPADPQALTAAVDGYRV